MIIRLCPLCDGRAYKPWPSHVWRRLRALGTEDGRTPYVCPSCRGSGIEGHTARSAYLEEHR